MNEDPKKANAPKKLDVRQTGSEKANGDASGAPSSESPARQVITLFGGIRPMASKLGVAVSTVQGWKEREVIPAARHPQVTDAAKAAGLKLDAGVLEASGHGEEGETPDQKKAPEAAAQTSAPAQAAAQTSAAAQVAAPKPDPSKSESPKAVAASQSSAKSTSVPPTTAKPGPAKTTTPPAATARPPAAKPVPPRQAPAQSSPWVAAFVLGAVVLGAQKLSPLCVT